MHSTNFFRKRFRENYLFKNLGDGKNVEIKN